jgi:type I restriction enzyme S subunit
MSFDLPDLPEGWQVVPLEGCTLPGSISYGVVQPGVPVSLGVPIVRVNNFSNGRLDLSDVLRVAPEVEAKYSRTRLSGGEVLLTLVGSVGQVAEVPPYCAGFNVARAVGVIRPASGYEAKWLAICLRSPLSQFLLGSRANTTVQTTINLKDVRALPVPMPPLHERAQIIEMVGALDDRIALLLETNATLEAIAQALFKSWFVDFDPVRAKSQGLAPAGMDEATAALFPDGFEETRRGPVPRGWREASIYDVAQVVYGAPFASSRFNTDGIGRPLVRIRDLRDEAPGVHTAEVHPKGYLLAPGDIVVGMDGEFRAYLWGGERAWLNQRVCVFQPQAGVPAAFVRASIEPQLAHIEATETATTVIHLGKGDIDRFVALVPPDDVLAAFGAIADPLYARIVANKQTCRSLAALRDTLLPRLISGQLRLPGAIAEAEEVV